MHITDDYDRPKDTYNPILDNEIDFDAPYIDFTYALNKDEIAIPNNGMYDTLYYMDTAILVVNQVSEIEIRFYSTVTPNENFRIGQRHIKGKVRSISKLTDENEDSDGYTLSFDASVQWNGKISNVTINNSYVNITKTRCIAILYFDEQGKVTNELVIPITDWFSPKVYLNSALTVTNPEPYPFKLNDLVDAVVYIKENTEDSESNEFNVVKKEYTGRLDQISLIKREYTTIDENGVDKTNTIYYYMIVIDISQDYQYETVTIASTVIESMKIHKLPPEEP